MHVAVDSKLNIGCIVVLYLRNALCYIVIGEYIHMVARRKSPIWT